MSKHPSHLLELARHGARARLRELAQEVKNLIDLFPDLRDSYDSDELPISFIVANDANLAKKARAAERSRRRMSAAARKAVSARMTKYWAARRKAPKG